ncbi:MAG: Ig-like domain-containing protein, partial [Candidatus Diapherotrites archaeon]
LNDTEDYTIDSGNDSTGTTREKNYSNREDGIVWFHLAACNSNGCSSTDHYKIKIDKTGPDVPTNIFGISQSDGSIFLSWDEPNDKPSGNNSGIREYNVYRSKDSGFEVNEPGVKKFTGIERTNYTDEDSSLVKGIAYYYRVQAIDNVGNEGVRSVDKKVLLSGGSCSLGINIDVPENVKAGELNIDISVSGGDLFDADIKVKMPGSGYETLSTNKEGARFEETYLVPEELSGTGSILVQGEDNEENTCEKQIEFTVDSVKPEITIDSPTEGEKVGGQVLIKVSADDSDSGIEKVEAFVEGIRIGTLEKKGDFYEVSWNSNSKLNKTYKLEVSAQDKAGNKTVAEIEIEVYNMNEEIFIEKNGSFNTSDLLTIFRNAGVKEELLSEAQTLFMENSPERKLLITKTDNGLKATIIITFKNSGQIKTLQLIEIIPKGVTNNADNIISDQQFSVVQQDPIIKFDLGEIANNKEVTVEYIAATGLTDQQANDVASQFDSYKAPPVLLEQSRQNPIEITPLSDILWIIFIIAAILIILLGGIGILGGGAFLFHRMKKNGNGLKSEGLHTVYKGKTSSLGGLFKKEPEEKSGKFAWNDD